MNVKPTMSSFNAHHSSIFRSGDGKVGIQNAPMNQSSNAVNGAGVVQEFKTGAYKRAKINYTN